MSKRAFIIGGTGQIGIATASRLIAEGWEVVLGSRNIATLPEDFQGRSVVLRRFDRSKTSELRAALGDGCDLLIDAVAFDAAHSRQLLDLSEDVGRIVAVSSASVYCDQDGRTLDEARQNGFPELPLEISEEQLTVDPGPATYSTRKIAMERALLDNASTPVVVLRPCAIHGPYSSHPREWWFVKRILDSRPIIPLAYGGRSRFQTSATANIAALISAIATSNESGVFNAVDPDSPSVLQIGEAILDACGAKAYLALVDDASYPSTVGTTPWSVPKPFTVSDRKSRSVGYLPKGTYTETVAESCAWLMRHSAQGWEDRFAHLAAYPYDLFDFQAEDRWLAASA